jgi:hypothetical protein
MLTAGLLFYIAHKNERYIAIQNFRLSSHYVEILALSNYEMHRVNDLQ